MCRWLHIAAETAKNKQSFYGKQNVDNGVGSVVDFFQKNSSGNET